MKETKSSRFYDPNFYHFLHAFHGKLLPARYLQISHRRKLEKLGVIWEKDGGIMDKLGGIVDKLGDIRDKLAGTIFKKQKFQTLYSYIPTFLYSNHNFLHDLHVLHGKSRLKNGAQSAHLLLTDLFSMTYKFRAGTKRCQKCTVWHIRDTIWHTRGAILHQSVYVLQLSAHRLHYSKSSKNRTLSPISWKNEKPYDHSIQSMQSAAAVFEFVPRRRLPVKEWGHSGRYGLLEPGVYLPDTASENNGRIGPKRRDRAISPFAVGPYRRGCRHVHGAIGGVDGKDMQLGMSEEVADFVHECECNIGPAQTPHELFGIQSGKSRRNSRVGFGPIPYSFDVR